jgi:hypothetical protein
MNNKILNCNNKINYELKQLKINENEKLKTIKRRSEK